VAYATAAELAAAPYNLTPANPDLLLDRASRDVDQALLCQVYDVDDPDNVAALKTATLEQAAGYLDFGDRTGAGVATPTQGFTLGRLSVQKATQGAGAASAQPSRIRGLWPQAWAVLQQAGLTGDGPQEPGYF
jgi:hypothetical protein